MQSFDRSFRSCKPFAIWSTTSRYTELQCLEFAVKGWLCSQGSCSAIDFLIHVPPCPDVQSFVPCVGCRPTCFAPEQSSSTCSDPPLNDCRPGCQCPADLPIWDQTSRVCVVASDCDVGPGESCAVRQRRRAARGQSSLKLQIFWAGASPGMG
jgi:hypothetical protein